MRGEDFMYITFDYKCPNCGHIQSSFVRRSEMDAQYHSECTNEDGTHPLMIRLPAGTRTHFRFADTKLKE